MEIESWAALLIDQLVKQGVTHFFLSPGSRSTPLALAIAAHSQAETMIHFDERGTAFYALGYAKASGKPAAVVVTTGTAAGNLLPAIMEAAQSFIPLLFLTADRPPELRDCGANQTIDQVKIFAPFVRWQCDLPCPDPHLSERYLRSTIAQACFRATESPQGPVHLNCMFREPLTSHLSSPYEIEPSLYEKTEKYPTQEVLEKWASLFNGSEKGIILLGSLPHGLSLEPIYALANQLKWPVFCDILSNSRSHRENSPLIPFYDLIVRNLSNHSPEIVLHLGERLVSKTVQEWLAKETPPHYFSVSDHPFRQDPKHLVTHRLTCSPLLFSKQLLHFLSMRSSSEWLTLWHNYSNQISLHLEEWKKEASSLTEPEIALSLEKVPDSWAIFLANSMPIRDADLFLFPQKNLAPCYSNRGVSGIDGNIATAIGIAKGAQRALVAVLGDLTTLHDLNSFALLKKASHPVIFIIVNNNGGAIFSFLPGINNHECFEDYFAHPHGLSFEKIAAFFEISYHHPLHQKEYFSTLHSCIEKGKSSIIEVITDRQANWNLHQTLYKANLCSPTQSLAL